MTNEITQNGSENTHDHYLHRRAIPVPSREWAKKFLIEAVTSTS